MVEDIAGAGDDDAGHQGVHDQVPRPETVQQLELEGLEADRGAHLWDHRNRSQALCLIFTRRKRFSQPRKLDKAHQGLSTSGRVVGGGKPGKKDKSLFHNVAPQTFHHPTNVLDPFLTQGQALECLPLGIFS